VQNGIVTLSAADLAGRYRGQIVEAVSRVRGAVRVEIMDAATNATPAPPATPTATPTEPARPLTVLREPETGVLPGGDLLFKPLIADPRWPHFSASACTFTFNEALRVSGPWRGGRCRGT
jgi:hypothetical protein